jgi:hypothetical protein
MTDLGEWGSSEVLGRASLPAHAFRLSALAACVFSVWLSGAAPSFAQARDPNAVISPVQNPVPKTAPDNAPNNDELGIPVGSFRLYPTLDLRAGYDSNVFAQPAGQQVSSAYEAIRPSLDLRSDWSNHMLNFGAWGAFGFYNSAPTQNYQNFGVSTDGRFDILRDLYLTGNAGFSRTTEALGTPDVAFAQSPTVVNAVPVNLALNQRFNRLFYQVSAGYTNYSYQDNSTISANVLPSPSRNRSEIGENLRAGYELRDGWDLWAQGGANQRRYQQFINVDNQQRDSNGWSITGGSTIDLGGVSKLEGYVGYSQQNYLNSGITTPAVIFGLGGVWNGYEPLVVRPFVVRSINETAFANYQDYTSTTIGVELIYQVYTAWQLNAGGSFGLADYTPAPGAVANGAFQHTDQFYRASIGALYSLFPQLQIGPLYEFASGYGPDPATSPNYTRHIIMLRLVARR